MTTWYVACSDGSLLVEGTEYDAWNQASAQRANGKHVVYVGTEPPCVSVSVELLQALADARSGTHAIKNDAIDAVLADAFPETE